MTKITQFILALLCIIVTSGGIKSAHAAGTGHEEMFIRKGVELRKNKRDAEALIEFLKAFDVAHTSRAAAQLGLCEQALEKWLQSHLHLSLALASESDTWVAQHRATLEKSRDNVAEKLGRIDVRGTPKDGMVVIGGDVVGRLSDSPSTYVLPGSTAVSITAEGYKPFKQTKQVDAGAAIVVNAELESIPMAAASPGRAQQPAVAPMEVVARPIETPTERTSVGPWIGWGAGGVLIGAGVLFGIRASSKAEEARTAAKYSSSAEDSAQQAEVLQWVCIGSGIVAIAAGSFFYLRAPGNTEVALAPTSLSDGATLSWQGRCSFLTVMT